MKSILHVALIAPTHSSSGIIKALEREFEEYFMFDWQKVKFREGYDGMRERLLMKAKMEQPEIVFLHVQNRDAIDVETTKELAKNSFVVNYTFDVRNDIEWMKEIAPHIGLTLFSDWESVKECQDAGINNVGFLAGSADYEWYTDLRIPRTNDIVFIGNNFVNTSLDFPQAQERYEMVEFMKKEFGDRFKVYGANWGADSKVLNPQEEIAVYNSAKIAITHNNFYRTGYTSDRLYRAIGCGVAVVSQEFERLSDMFTDIGDAQFWETFNDLRIGCDELLKDAGYRNRIAVGNREYFLRHHSWTNRVRELKKLIKNNNHGVSGSA